MAIPQKSASVVGLQSGNELPDYKPRLPSTVIERFPDLKRFQEQTVQFHEVEKKALTRILDELNRSLLSASQTLTAIQSALSDVQAQVEAIESAEPVTVTASTAPDLTAELATHILDTSTHGVAGDIVGTTDEQDLEAKTIGFDSPRPARFATAVIWNKIPASESYAIPADHSQVVAGTFTIYGNLEIAGVLTVL